MPGSIPVFLTYHVSLAQLRSEPSSVHGKNASRIQGSSTTTANCGSTSDRYGGESNATGGYDGYGDAQ